MLDTLNRVNDVPVYSVFDDKFRTFGNVVTGYDFSATVDALLRLPIPAEGNVYVASEPTLECLPVFAELQNGFYGGMPIQIGYCNGRNTTYNGFEYHKCSEINVAASDFCLVLGHTWQISSNTFRVGEETVFFVPKGTAVELFQTTLHLSPCRVCDEGFRAAVVLARGTNTPLQNRQEPRCDEDRLLLQTNKWVLAHPDREPLMRQGAVPGLLGENKEIKYR